MSALDALRPKERRAIDALLTAPTISVAAGTVGVHPRTLRRWLKREGFSEALAESARATHSAVIRRAQSATAEALQVLLDIASDSTAPAAARVSSAKAIIDLGVRRSELDEVADWISRILKDGSLDDHVQQRISDFAIEFSGSVQ